MNTMTETQAEKSPYPPIVHLDDGVMLGPDAPHAPAETKGLPGVTLMPHQQVLLAWLIHIAKTRVITTAHNTRVLTNGAWLYLAYGAGKTYIILSFVLHWLRGEKIPIQPLAIPRASGGHVNQLLTAQYAKLTPAFIFVGIQVYEQWLGQIAKTDMKVFALRDAEALKRFIPLVNRRDINAYDIVLVKNGNVQGSDFNLPGEEPGDDFRPMIAAVRALLRGLMVGIVVYDDFDTSGLMKSAVALDSAFTLGVSASQAFTHVEEKIKRKTRTPVDIFDALQIEGLPRVTTTPMGDSIFCGMFRATVLESYIKIVPAVKFSLVVLTTQGDVMLRMMKLMGEEGKQLAELLNGGAKKAAAGMLNCVVKTTGGFFGNMIGKRERVMVCAARALRVFGVMDKYYLGMMTAGIGGVEPRKIISRVLKGKVPYPREEVEHANTLMLRATKDNVMEVKAALAARNARLNKSLLKDKEILYSSEGLRAAIESGVDQAKQIIAEIEPHFRALREQFAAGNCAVCKCEFDKELPISINKCCGVMLCGPCGAKCSKYDQRIDARTGEFILAGMCPQCRAPVTAKSIVILRDPGMLKKIDLDGSIADQIDDEEEDVPEENVTTDKNATIEQRIQQIENEKIRCLVMIMLGMPIPQQRSANIKLKNLLGGGGIVPQREGIPKKVLVVANVEETHISVKKALDEFGIKYYRHAGTTHDRDKIVQQFRDETRTSALLVTAPHTSGMDLPFLTDTVLMHWILDLGVLGQVVGRGQRIIRTEGSMNVHFLVYENEVADFKAAQVDL